MESEPAWSLSGVILDRYAKKRVGMARRGGLNRGDTAVCRQPAIRCCRLDRELADDDRAGLKDGSRESSPHVGVDD